MLYFLQQVLNGLHVGALYALLAFGYALSHAVLHRANLAHGAVFAFCGQVMIVTVNWGWFVLWLVWPVALGLGAAAAIAYAVLTGVLVGRHVLAPLANRSPNTVVTATLGVSIALMEWLRIATGTRDVWLPPMLGQPIVFAADPDFRVTLTALQIIDLAVAALAIGALHAWLASSRFGRNWAALADDPRAAALCGVDTGRIFVQTIVASAASAALAGILAGLYYGNLSFGTGLLFGLKILFVTAVGGFESPSRAALGGLAFGLAETIWSGYFPIEWRDAAVFAFLIALLVLRGSANDSPINFSQGR